jgi:hypothetical protein
LHYHPNERNRIEHAVLRQMEKQYYRSLCETLAHIVVGLVSYFAAQVYRMKANAV